MRRKGLVIGLWLLIVGVVACTYQPVPVQSGEEEELAAQAGFVNVGGPISSPITSFSQFIFRSKLILDKNGQPIVALRERDSNNIERLYVKRWNGQSWQSLGGPVGKPYVENIQMSLAK
jgi:hypothetical protein